MQRKGIPSSAREEPWRPDTELESLCEEQGAEGLGGEQIADRLGVTLRVGINLGSYILWRVLAGVTV